MAEYSKLITTAKGQALVAKVIAGTAEDYDFTRIVTSDDEYEVTDLEALTSLTEKQSSVIASKEIVNTVGVKVSASFTNASLATGYYMKSLGLYATDPDEGEILFAACVETTGNCYMPPYTGVTVSGAEITMTTVVSNSSDVDITIDPTAVATISQLNAVESRVTTNETDISNIKTFVGYAEDDIYGVEVDFENKTFTRLAGAVGKTAGADFDGINAFGGRKRCNVADDGTVNAYYGDGSYSEDGSNGQVMVEQPKFYYKVVPIKTENTSRGTLLRKARYYVSDIAKPGFKLHPAFEMDGAKLEKVYVSAFDAASYDVSASTYITNDAQTVDFSNDKLASIANAKPLSGLSQGGATRSGFRTIAANRGTGWSQEIIQTSTMSELLMLIEYASFDMQTAIGRGNVDKASGSGNEAENSGATSSLGNASGSVTNGNSINIVSYRGEENFWGNIWNWVDGINIHAGRVYIADNGFTDNTSSGYTDTGITCINANGYVSAFIYVEEFDWLFIAGEVSGSDALPVGDYFYQNADQNDWRVAKLGASWGSASESGAFCWSLNDVSSYRSRYIGGRLVYRKASAA